MSIYWDPVSEEWIDDEGAGDQQTTWVFPGSDSGGNLERDFTVTETGLIQDSRGNLGTFKSDTWTPYLGGDIKTFLTGSSAPSTALKGIGQKASQYIKKLFTGEGSMADYGTAIAGLLGLYEQMTKDSSPKMWEGKVTKTPYVAPTVTPQYQAAVQQRPYGTRLMGMDPFSYAGGIPSALPAQPPAAITLPPTPTPAPTPKPTAAPTPTPAPTPKPTAAPTPTPAPPPPPAAPATAAPAVQQQYKLPSWAFTDLDPTEKAALYNSFRSRGFSNDYIRQIAERSGAQTDKDWSALEQLALQMPQNLIPGDQTPTKGDIQKAVMNWRGQTATPSPAPVAAPVAAPEGSEGYRFATQPGGIGEDKFYENIFNFIKTNPDEAAQKAAQQQYGVSDADVYRTKMKYNLLGNTGFYAPPSSGSFAHGGIADLARGGALAPRYLRGQTDGMADKIPSNIDGVQPAKLSHGEFVIPADVVSHLGNGNSDAGAKVLYKMMDRVRRARTGTKKQGKQINPDKFTPGGIAGYAGGGAVAFQTGGTTVNPAGTGGTLTGGLSPYIGDYIAGPEGYLSKAWGLGDKPYQAYTGPLTAGTSPLQQQAYQGLSALEVPGQFGTATSLAEKAGTAAQTATYDPTKFSSDYTAGEFKTGLGEVGSVQSYMNPYLQGVTDIEAREARRQADIGRQAEQARLAQAGAYGGSRQAIMEAERQRNLQTQIGDIASKGLQSAYDRALAQRFQEAGLGLQAKQMGEQAKQFGATQEMQAQQLSEQSKQFGANLGLQGIGQQLAASSQLGNLGAQQFGTQLQGLNALLGAGREQQATEREAVEAGIRQFQEAQRYPYEQLKFQQSMIQGLPVSTSTTTPNTSMFSDLTQGIGGLLGLYERLGKLGS